MLLVLAFFGMMIICFGVVAVVMRSSSDQKAVDRRLTMIGDAGREIKKNSAALDQLLKETKKLGILERIFGSYGFSKKFQLLILQANSTMTIGKLLIISAGVAFAGFLICLFFVPAPLIAGGVGLIAAYIPLGILLARRSRRINSFNKGLPDCIDMMGRALRAGHSMVSALSMIADQGTEPARSEFAEVFKQQNYGLPLRDALMQLLDRVPSQDLRVLVTAILVQKDTGGNLAEILDRTVHVIRERLRIQGEIRIHTAQGRLTGWILCALPIILMILLNIMNPGYSKIMLDNPFGRKLLYVGATLLAIGIFVVNRIVNGIEI